MGTTPRVGRDQVLAFRPSSLWSGTVINAILAPPHRRVPLAAAPLGLLVIEHLDPIVRVSLRPAMTV